MNLKSNPEPSVGIIDSQSVKTGSSGEERGCDRAKKVKGRKRHLMVDRVGGLILVRVTAASAQESDVGPALLINVKAKTHRLKQGSADQG